MSGIALSSGSHVLVTGASGVIGRHVVALLRGEVSLFCVSRRQREQDDGVTWLEADLSTPGSAARVVAAVEPSAVVHLAGAVRGDRSLDAVLPTLRANLVGTVELLEAVTRARVPRVIVSGSLLEEPGTGDLSSIAPSPYGASRWSSSMYARMFHGHFGTPVTILRPSYAYGPGQEDKLIPHVISSALRGISPELASGDRRIDFVYAEDVARAYIAALTAPDAIGETLDIGCGQLTRVRDVVDVLLALIGPEAPHASYGAVGERPFEQEIEVDTTRAAHMLGWAATTSLNDGLQRTLEWFQARSG